MSAAESNSTAQSPATAATSTPAEHSLPARPPVAQNAAVFAFKPRAMAPVSRPAPAPSPIDTTYYAQGQQQSYPPGSGQAGSQHFPSYANHLAYSDQQGYNANAYGVSADGQSGLYNHNSNPYGMSSGTGYGASAWQDSQSPGPNSAKGNGTNSGAKLPKPARADNRTVIRSGGGKTWEDPTLLDWPEDHHCLFIGNLAGEVTDESLLKAFSKYPSVSKARVIRDSSTSKSKGYGFVSLGDAEEYFQAAKEMTGKYIGSHPVTISRANRGGKKSTYKVVEKDAKYYKKYHHQQHHNKGHGAGQQQDPQKAKGSGIGGGPGKASKEQSPNVLKADPTGGIRKTGKGGSKLKVLG